MLDIANDIDSLSNFKRHTLEFINRLKAGGRPVVLTSRQGRVGRQDAAAYQKLIDIAEELAAGSVSKPCGRQSTT